MKGLFTCTVSVLALSAIAACTLPRNAAAVVVFDPTNYQQNLLSALRALDTVNNQLRQLQNEAQMLLRMDRNLQALPGSLSPHLTQVLSDLQRQVASGDAIALKLQETDANFERLYPKTFAATLSGDDVIRSARARWQETHAAFKRAALVQGQVSENTTSDQRVLADLLSRSEGAAGALQAAQAGNELAALNVKQTLQLQTLLATQARADTADRARAVTAQEEARQQFKAFLGEPRAYTRR
jgi:P-type conjugative transfer protein TrbJ